MKQQQLTLPTERASAHNIVLEFEELASNQLVVKNSLFIILSSLEHCCTVNFKVLELGNKKKSKSMYMDGHKHIF